MARVALWRRTCNRDVRRTAEEAGEIAVAVTLGVVNVRLEPEHVPQALLDEPDDLRVLVVRAGDVPSRLSSHGSPLLTL
jgi:hypothetical protein